MIFQYLTDGMVVIVNHAVANEAAGGSTRRVRPLWSAPAARAGLLPGETFVEVFNIYVSTMLRPVMKCMLENFMSGVCKCGVLNYHFMNMLTVHS